MKGIRVNRPIPWLLVIAAALPLHHHAQEAEGAQQATKVEEVIQIKLGKTEFTFTTAEAARGIKLPFEVIVKGDLPGMIPLPPGPSYNTPAGPSGLFPYMRISGKGQSYAPLDYGLGAPPEGKVQTIKKGRYEGSFAWDGRNWNGPSDFGNPKGQPFPPGEYTITVTAIGKMQTPKGERPYTISGSAKLVLK